MPKQEINGINVEEDSGIKTKTKSKSSKTKSSDRPKKSKSSTKPQDVESDTNGLIELDYEPEKIVGANEIDGRIFFRVKVKDTGTYKTMKAKLAHKVCPDLVIQFYEKHLILDGEYLDPKDFL